MESYDVYLMKSLNYQILTEALENIPALILPTHLKSFESRLITPGFIQKPSTLTTNHPANLLRKLHMLIFKRVL